MPQGAYSNYFFQKKNCGWVVGLCLHATPHHWVRSLQTLIFQNVNVLLGAQHRCSACFVPCSPWTATHGPPPIGPRNGSHWCWVDKAGVVVGVIRDPLPIIRGGGGGPSQVSNPWTTHEIGFLGYFAILMLATRIQIEIVTDEWLSPTLCLPRVSFQQRPYPSYLSPSRATMADEWLGLLDDLIKTIRLSQQIGPLDVGGLLQKVALLRSILSQKDSDLATSAEMGQQLLSTNRHLKAQLDEAHATLDSQEEEYRHRMHETALQIDELTGENRQLSLHIKEYHREITSLNTKQLTMIETIEDYQRQIVAMEQSHRKELEFTKSPSPSTLAAPSSNCVQFKDWANSKFSSPECDMATLRSLQLTVQEQQRTISGLQSDLQTFTRVETASPLQCWYDFSPCMRVGLVLFSHFSQRIRHTGKHQRMKHAAACRSTLKIGLGCFGEKSIGPKYQSHP